jgi:DNA polymerase sigma
MTDSTRSILRRLKSLLQERVALSSLTLFGSMARGDADRDSDMDVLVIVEYLDPEVDERVSECAWQVSLECGIVVVPVTLSRDEWENGPERSSLLALAVKREGIPV